MNLTIDLSVDGRTLGLLVTLLIVWGTLYDLGLAWAYKNLPKAQILLYHLSASCLGIGLTVLLTIPVIGAQDALTVLAALGVAGLPIAIGVLSRYFRPFTRWPALNPHIDSANAALNREGDDA